MYTRKREEILKEVDNFIAQAKLEGEISGSSSSVSVQNLTTQENEKCYIVQQSETKPSSENNTLILNRHDIDSSFALNGNETSNFFNEREKDNEFIEKIPLKHNLIKDDNLDIYHKEENHISKSESALQNTLAFNNRNNDDSDTIKKSKKEKISYKEDNCESSFVELGSESSRSSMPYVMWLQETRSKQNLLKRSDEDNQSKMKYSHRQDVHLHEVNSALFWERWIDKIFDIYDQWVQSSESDEDSNDEWIRTQSGKETKNKGFPTRIQSEPTIRGASQEVANLKYKCPSYVDWLVQKRLERQESSESDETVVENKKQDGYWSSLYGKLTKSLSSIFISSKPIDEKDQLEEEQSETTALVNHPTTGSPTKASAVKQVGLRRSHSVSCSYYQSSTPLSNKLRHRQLNQDAVGSPVLTDQLVELVCNTLSPDSSDGSSSQEDYRRRKLNRRRTKRTT